MRDRRFTLHQAFRNTFAHSGKLNARAALEWQLSLLRCRRNARLYIFFPLRRCSLFFFCFSRCRLFRFSLFLFWFFGFLCFFLWRLFFFFFFLRRLLLFLGRGFAFLADEGNPLADVNLTALFHVTFGERSILGRFPFHRRLVGFDFSNDVAGRDFIALLLFPRDERPLRHRVAQFGHLDFRHVETS